YYILSLAVKDFLLRKGKKRQKAKRRTSKADATSYPPHHGGTCLPGVACVPPSRGENCPGYQYALCRNPLAPWGLVSDQCWRKSTAGSRKDLIRRTCRRQRPGWKSLRDGTPPPSFVPSGRISHSDDHCLYAVFLLHGLLDFDDPLLHSEPFFRRHRQI